MSSRFPARLALHRRRVSFVAAVMRRGCAWILVLLAVLPFTAPFPSCDVATLLARSLATAPVADAVSVSWSTPRIAVAATEAPAAPILDEESFKDVELVGVIATPMPLVARAAPPRVTVVASVVRTPLVALRL